MINSYAFRPGPPATNTRRREVKSIMIRRWIGCMAAFLGGVVTPFIRSRLVVGEFMPCIALHRWTWVFMHACGMRRVQILGVALMGVLS